MAVVKVEIDEVKIKGLLADVVVELNAVIEVLPGFVGKRQDEWCKAGGIAVTLDVIAITLCEIFQVKFLSRRFCLNFDLNLYTH